METETINDFLRKMGVFKMETTTGCATEDVTEYATVDGVVRNILGWVDKAKSHTEDEYVIGCLAQIAQWAKSLTTAVTKKETTTDENSAVGNAAKMCEDDDWLNQLVNLINGEIAHYMSQGADYFSVDCGPWLIHYDNSNGEYNESK